MRVLPYYKVHISISAIIVTVASGKKLQRLLGNTNDGRPDNRVGVCEDIYNRP